MWTLTGWIIAHGEESCVFHVAGRVLIRGNGRHPRMRTMQRSQSIVAGSQYGFAAPEIWGRATAWASASAAISGSPSPPDPARQA